ncbi:glycerol-3-phosphate acyltransferase [Actinomadura madurae]|uniref:glycerol-3-phosphate acyltransferase n=1 Tax=Actinomadura madurae TaxID=1993 RepID=UPI002025BB15|nr:glycerol-3-phosphate acyltransferase [Actinomadura madurae]MCP9951797.1 glycerol-3-phosphate acyltransferase [Actinomadura madurae]MCP9968567.1 glycerol-3-phosphate acyltransferase [Actinomadura madurae]MCQ0007462.1 glycerol-3-phosphate acyltransferase [Actinomadura madurae]MCQ0017234.1 glycerol-3-phosphate acyltransferase [Actinomadura madurae]URM97159.1 glycerol-3-phosphate acyltransferase [Actinomadura madurae]
MIPVLVAVIGGYLLGSVPVAVLVGRAHGFDPRDVGDRNPGFWNVMERLGWKAAVPVFAGDMLKGTAAGLLGLLASGVERSAAGSVAGESVLPVYAAVAAAMVGHAWPVFAGGRGGRSILTFAGGFAVICPAAFALGVALLVVGSLAFRSFVRGTRLAVFSLPVLQLFFAPVEQVAGTGALMCLIGLRFGQAALAGRRT